MLQLTLALISGAQASLDAVVRRESAFPNRGGPWYLDDPEFANRAEARAAIAAWKAGIPRTYTNPCVPRVVSNDEVPLCEYSEGAPCVLVESCLPTPGTLCDFVSSLPAKDVDSAKFPTLVIKDVDISEALFSVVEDPVPHRKAFDAGAGEMVPDHIIKELLGHAGGTYCKQQFAEIQLVSSKMEDSMCEGDAAEYLFKDALAARGRFETGGSAAERKDEDQYGPSRLPAACFIRFVQNLRVRQTMLMSETYIVETVASHLPGSDLHPGEDAPEDEDEDAGIVPGAPLPGNSGKVKFQGVSVFGNGGMGFSSPLMPNVGEDWFTYGAIKSGIRGATGPSKAWVKFKRTFLAWT